MHEWALAEGVVETALRSAAERNLQRIDKIVVRIGQLQQIESELFSQSLQQVVPTDQSLLDHTTYEMETEEAALCCRVCNTEFPFAEALAKLDETEAEAIHFIPELAHTFVQCPSCQSPDFAVSKGRGVTIARIEGI